jgi:hypothetical protein
VAAVTVSGVVRALAGAGWGLAQPDGAAPYAAEDPAGSLVWTTSRRETSDEAAILNAAPRQGRRVGVSLFHDKAGTGGQLLFSPERDGIEFLPTINRRAHLETMLPALHTCGLMGYTARDHVDFKPPRAAGRRQPRPAGLSPALTAGSW